MPKLADLCRDIRSKNAGPFWITVDVFFRDRELFDRYADAAALQPDALAPLFGLRPGQLSRYPVPDLAVLKFSYPRRGPQGGMIERDLHGGQQFVCIVDVDVEVT